MKILLKSKTLAQIDICVKTGVKPDDLKYFLDKFCHEAKQANKKARIEQYKKKIADVVKA